MRRLGIIAVSFFAMLLAATIANSTWYKKVWERIDYRLGEYHELGGRICSARYIDKSEIGENIEYVTILCAKDEGTWIQDCRLNPRMSDNKCLDQRTLNTIKLGDKFFCRTRIWVPLSGDWSKGEKEYYGCELFPPRRSFYEKPAQFARAFSFFYFIGSLNQPSIALFGLLDTRYILRTPSRYPRERLD